MANARTIQIVRCEPSANRIATVPGISGLLLEAEGRLWLADRDLLLERARKRENVRLGDTPGVDLLVEDAGTEWSVNPASHTVACVNDALILAPLDGTPGRRRISLPPLGDPAAAAFGDDQEEIFLVKTLCDEDTVVDRTDFHCVDTRSGAVTWPKALSVYGVSQACWSTAAGAFFVHEMSQGRLWQLLPRTSVLQEISLLPENNSLEPCDIAFDAGGETAALHFQDSENGRHWVQFGIADGSGIRWESPRPLNGQITSPLWLHPRGNVWACEIEQGLHPRLVVCDRECTVLWEMVLPFGWFSQGMAWSSRSDDLYLLGLDTIGILCTD